MYLWYLLTLCATGLVAYALTIVRMRVRRDLCVADAAMERSRIARKRESRLDREDEDAANDPFAQYRPLLNNPMVQAFLKKQGFDVSQLDSLLSGATQQPSDKEEQFDL